MDELHPDHRERFYVTAQRKRWQVNEVKFHGQTNETWLIKNDKTGTPFCYQWANSKLEAIAYIQSLVGDATLKVEELK